MKKEEHAKCDNCSLWYPLKYLKPFLSGITRYDKVCGICALDISNEVLGIVGRTHFIPGSLAEKFRLLAIEYRNRRQKPIERLGAKKK